MSLKKPNNHLAEEIFGFVVHHRSDGDFVKEPVYMNFRFVK